MPSVEQMDSVQCRKPVWARLHKAAVQKLQAAQFSPMTAGEAKDCLQARQLGVSTLRLLPKATGKCDCRDSCKVGPLLAILPAVYFRQQHPVSIIGHGHCCCSLPCT